MADSALLCVYSLPKPSTSNGGDVADAGRIGERGERHVDFLDPRGVFAAQFLELVEVGVGVRL